MGIVNVHERRFPVPAEKAGALIDRLSAEEDPLWPRGKWHSLRFDRPLGVGAAGGHGPIRYHVIAYVPGQWVRFRFDRPRGFDGIHEFTVLPEGGDTMLRHMAALRLHGGARLAWPLMWGPMHDALLEDLLDRAEENLLGRVARPSRYSLWVRLLRNLPWRKRR
ncbi:MAG: SRPBCC family protein [Nocardiopsaceae bacterium]|nr:SRPBCC family protein [Nocardiopsaceae bacterium]